MKINGFVFFWLVVLALIGFLCIGIALFLISWILWEIRKEDCERKRLHQENQQVRRLLHSVLDDPGQGASV